MREVLLLPQATVDMAAGQVFYERQSPGLGLYFRDAINVDLRSLLVSAGVHRVVHGLQRGLCKRFPYAIYYRIEGDGVFVHAVLDCRRDPAGVKGRVLGR